MSPSAPVIHISATPKKPVGVDLLGTVYQVKTPKTALLLAISRHSGKKGDKSSGDAEKMGRDFDTIIQLMFGAKVAPQIQERLEDPEDDLDLDHIFEIIDKLTEEATGNPTS
jgi:hypothetical protein